MIIRNNSVHAHLCAHIGHIVVLCCESQKALHNRLILFATAVELSVKLEGRQEEVDEEPYQLRVCQTWSEL